MKFCNLVKYVIIPVIFSLFILIIPNQTIACSTFKLQKGEKLVYGHNLNQGDIGVPGMIFINKRSIYKMGMTWSELTTPDRQDASSHRWISRYGSITFNVFGIDMPDGGMNECGLFIWEMSEDPEYPENTGKPKLDQMNWMQYILDNFSTTEEAIQCASDIEVSGWGWHFFVGDASGDCASITFENGEPVIHSGSSMPVPALFNTPYNREMEIAKYYKEFGGQYGVTIDDPNVPRFVKTATLINEYKETDNIVEYGLDMLDKLQVDDEPEWSVLFDVRTGTVYFKTRLNPEIKRIRMSEIDFSNKQPTLIQNMDIKSGGNVIDGFVPYSNQAMRDFIESLIVPILPVDVFTQDGLALDECLDRLSSNADRASSPKNMIFVGEWHDQDEDVTVVLRASDNRITGQTSNGKDTYPIDHIHMIAEDLTFTFKTKGGMFVEIKAKVEDDTMNLEMFTTEDYAGNFSLIRL